MGHQEHRARLCRLLAGLGAATCAIASTGCGFKTHFPDMRLQLDALSMPKGYEFVADTERGAPPFEDAHVQRIYRSPRDLEATCNELQAHFQDRSPTITRHQRGCTVGFWVSAGWRAKLWGVWRYSAGVSASAVTHEGSRLHDDEPREPYTRVLVTLWDRHGFWW